MTKLAARGIRVLAKCDYWGMRIMLDDHSEFFLRKYEVTTHRLNAVDQWAQNFVSLYFVFCAALIAGAGYAATLEAAKQFCLFHSQIPAGPFTLAGASALGLFVSLWASTMVAEWFVRRRRIIRQMRDLERNLDKYGPPMGETRHREWGKARLVDWLAMIMTALVLAATVLGWSVLLAGTRSSLLPPPHAECPTH
jgi:hypothetical protein